ncbi:alpha-L-fucosidase [Schaalia sp. 19OD2882]|uniref:alpha-L-fucosidase n=1 Tax=Schaalia sp. 19OD2882 TaxID=2794089 RepID=UPI001C1EDC0F|nr:alpha-L-fucosidase [Schaalia sp. 19OD2882]QWW20513.1 alpha-L-fucosidase [Schaalia sp. 19OD2882]
MSNLPAATRDDTSTRWFDHSRLGLFVHFGLYSVAARHEWVMTRERRTVADYERYAEVFDPDLFDARDIARRAKRAGMGYAVLTTKHHDGFCLFDSAHTTYTSMVHQGRDFVAEWCRALRAEGLKVGLYHSLLDWHHEDFTLDFHHPRRDDPDARSQNEGKDFSRYRTYLHNQVRELLTNYGTIDYLFFDFSYPWTVDGWTGKGKDDWGSIELEAMCRSLQPGIIINDRLDIPGDLVTPEQYQPCAPMEVGGVPVRWEACQTLNGSWGYDRDNTDFKSVDLVLRMLVDTVSKGGNLLLNIGPDGRGAVTAHDGRVLDEIAEWMRLNSTSVIGAGPANLRAPDGVVYTRAGNRLYIHVMAWPFGHLHLPDLAGKVRFVRFLADGSEIRTEVHDPDKEALTTEVGGQPAGTLTLVLPTRPPSPMLPVIEVLLEDGID